jgi:hypothetical protein
MPWVSTWLFAGGLIHGTQAHWKARKGWYVDLDANRFKLGPDRDEAHRELHRLLSLTPEQRAPKVAVQATTGPTVADIFDRYLDWVQKHRAHRTYDWYLEHIQSFTDFLPKPDEMPLPELKPFHVVEWVSQAGPATANGEHL